MDPAPYDKESKWNLTHPPVREEADITQSLVVDSEVASGPLSCGPGVHGKHLDYCPQMKEPLSKSKFPEKFHQTTERSTGEDKSDYLSFPTLPSTRRYFSVTRRESQPLGSPEVKGESERLCVSVWLPQLQNKVAAQLSEWGVGRAADINVGGQ